MKKVRHVRHAFHAVRDGEHFLECPDHGDVSGPLTQGAASARHGDDCPRCKMLSGHQEAVVGEPELCVIFASGRIHPSCDDSSGEAVFWLPNSAGYTTNLDEAGLYPPGFKLPRPNDILVPVSKARKMAKLTVSRGDLLAATKE